MSTRPLADEIRPQSLDEVVGIRPDTALVVEQAHTALDKGADL